LLFRQKYEFKINTVLVAREFEEVVAPHSPKPPPSGANQDAQLIGQGRSMHGRAFHQLSETHFLPTLEQLLSNTAQR
jgi:hypothetical protein